MARKRDMQLILPESAATRENAANRDRLPLVRLRNSDRWVNLLACDAFDPETGDIAYGGTLRGTICRVNRGAFTGELCRKCETALQVSSLWLYLPSVKQWHRLGEVGEMQFLAQPHTTTAAFPPSHLTLRFIDGHELTVRQPEDQDALAAALGFAAWLSASRDGREELCPG